MVLSKSRLSIVLEPVTIAPLIVFIVHSAMVFVAQQLKDKFAQNEMVHTSAKVEFEELENRVQLVAGSLGKHLRNGEELGQEHN